VAILIVVILIVLGIHSCQVSARNSALRDYNHNLTTVIQQSDQTGAQLFAQLSGGSGASDPQGLTNQLNETRVSAESELNRAKGFDVPDEVRGAQQNLLLALSLRRDGIADIAMRIQRALGTSASKDAIDQIAADMARFLASDVIYKTQVAPMVAAALHAAGITVGPNGEQIEGGQFLTDISWLSPDFVATKLGSSAATSGGAKGSCPSVCGHSLDSVSVGGTTLQTGSTNTIPASPPPAFTVHITNGGKVNESNVVVKVAVSGTNITGQTTIPQTTAGQSTAATVTLPSSPPPGNYTVQVTVAPVPGEKNVANNSLSFPVTFQ
jgi:hypothetical protein